MEKYLIFVSGTTQPADENRSVEVLLSIQYGYRQVR
jgi:hypothetical protein